MRFNSLSQLLEGSSTPVFQDPDGEILGHAFWANVKNSCVQLNQLPHHRIGIYFESTSDFCRVFLSLLLAGKVPIILPNIQQGFINSVIDWLDLIITDQPISSNIDTLTLSALNSGKCTGELAEIDWDQSSIELFTSGSTGQPKRITKTLYQLESEVQAHEALWGKAIQKSLIVSTVSHQHIYGLLFKVLGPLFYNRCVWVPLCHYPEQWLELTSRVPLITLISSPAHLKRAHSLIDLSTARARISMVFSSGGPFAAVDSQKIYKQLQQPVTEVYGSTETGGVAFRSQYQSETHTPNWTPLPGIRICRGEQNGCLMVKSAFLHDSNWYQTSDLVELISESEFILLGRADRIVKVEEKRVSLAEIESILNKSPLVDQTAAIALPSKRTTLACLVVLSTKGVEVFAEIGKSALNELLKSHLSEHFETIALPRKWRLVSQLPMNEQGKLRYDKLQDYFTSKYQPPNFPIIEQQDLLDDCVQLRVRIPPDLDYFDGHFLKKPILPGVVQIEWAGILGRKLLPVKGVFSELEKIKFHEFILPGDRIDISLSYSSDKNKLAFSFSSVRGLHSSGRIAYRI